MVGVGGIVSVGGNAGGSSGGSTSGITSINSQTGPSIIINGANGITVLTTSNVITIDGSSLSGLIGSVGVAQSGVIGVNGIDVQQVDGNFVVDGASVSGTRRFAESFVNVTSGQFTHGLGTRDVLIQVYEEDPLASQILPDKIIRDTPNVVSLLFNRPQSGRIIVVG